MVMIGAFGSLMMAAMASSGVAASAAAASAGAASNFVSSSLILVTSICFSLPRFKELTTMTIFKLFRPSRNTAFDPRGAYKRFRLRKADRDYTPYEKQYKVAVFFDKSFIHPLLSLALENSFYIVPSCSWLRHAYKPESCLKKSAQAILGLNANLRHCPTRLLQKCA